MYINEVYFLESCFIQRNEAEAMAYLGKQDIDEEPWQPVVTLKKAFQVPVPKIFTGFTGPSIYK